MEEMKQVAFRLPMSLVDALDRYAEHMAAENPGLSPNRSDAARMLLTQALADFPAPRAKTKAARSK